MRIYMYVLFAALAIFSFAGEVQAKTKNLHPTKIETPDPNLPKLPVFRPVVTTYAVYVGGLHFITANFLFQEDGNKYSVQTHAKTQGFWGRLLPWEANIISKGSIKGDRFIPQTHMNASTWRGETKTIWMHYDNQKNIAVSFDPIEQPSEKRNIISSEQKKGAFDPLSGIVQLLGDLALNNSCQAAEPLFDGRRRFDLIGLDKGQGYTDPDDYGIYKGLARRCDIGFDMIAGEWKDRERSRFWQHIDGSPGREPFQIWLAKLADDLPELAVRAESPTVWGRIVVHLSGWHYATNKELYDNSIMPLTIP